MTERSDREAFHGAACSGLFTKGSPQEAAEQRARPATTKLNPWRISVRSQIAEYGGDAVGSVKPTVSSRLREEQEAEYQDCR